MYSMLWCIVGQGMFALQEINQMEHEMCSYLEWQPNVNPSILVDYHVVIEEPLRLNPTCAHPAISPIWDGDQTHHSCHNMIVDICHKMEPTSLIMLHFPLCISPTLEAINNMTLTATTSLALLARASPGSSPQQERERSHTSATARAFQLSLLLQKTNIIRDFRDGADWRHFFWLHNSEIRGSPKYSPTVAPHPQTSLSCSGTHATLHGPRLRW